MATKKQGSIKDLADFQKNNDQIVYKIYRSETYSEITERNYTVL